MESVSEGRPWGMSASSAPEYIMTPVPNMATMSTAPMVGGGGAAFSPYQPFGTAAITMQPQFTMQIPNGAPMYPQSTGVSGYQMYQSPTNAEGPQVISPAQLSALMKTPGAMISSQMTNWTQYGGMQQALGGYPSALSYATHSSGNPYIIDYSDGLNILDEPTGGTTCSYMPK